jgi:RNase H-fold protein (predicted Holliday junction resolvase)
MQIQKASNFPVISRGGRTSAELQQIIDCLVQSSENGQAYSIVGIPMGKKYNSMQQRIRAQAKKLNLQVQIHFSKQDETLYFRVPQASDSEVTIEKNTSVKTKDVKSVKTVVKA